MSHDPGVVTADFLGERRNETLSDQAARVRPQRLSPGTSCRPAFGTRLNSDRPRDTDL